MPSLTVSRGEALRKRTQHQFIPGLGYIAHGSAPDLPKAANGNKNCEPIPGTADGSIHLLRPPTGAPPLALVWIAAERAWASLKPEAGNRLAWLTGHLSRAGWEYVGPIQ